jgi:hypothetical protein
MMIIAGINIIMHTSRIYEQITSNTDKEITSIPNTSIRNCNRNWKRWVQIAYGAAGGFTFAFRFVLVLRFTLALAPASSAMSSMYRLLMSEKKSSSGKESSVDVMPSVVAQKRSPKT